MAKRIPHQAWYASPAPYFQLSTTLNLGPRPLVYLPGKKGVEGGVKVGNALSKYYRHGMIGLNVTDFQGVENQAKEVIAMMDSFNISWSHFICHSYGALLGAFLTWKHPDRIGSLILLDSPITTPAMQTNDELRSEIKLLSRNPNIAETIKLMKSKLDKSEPVFPVADTQDNEIIGNLFQNTVSSDLLTRDSTAYLSPEQQRTIRHPALLIVPSQGPILDKTLLTSHRQLMNVRKLVTVKEASSHVDLLENETATQIVAESIGQWCERFDTMSSIIKRWKQISEEGSKDFRTKEDEAAQAPVAPEAKQSRKEGKKKEKKGKQ
eukprot:PhF_6_TR24012/c0_g1_i1/m.33619